MSRRYRRYTLTLFAGISGIIALILIPIAINVATSELPQWVQAHRNWAWLAIVAFGSFTIIFARVSELLRNESSGQPSTDELNEITTKVNRAAYTANHDPTLKDQENWIATLDSWKTYAETLVTIYGEHQKRQDKQSKRITRNSLDLLEKLTNATKSCFLYLNRKPDLIAIASAAYSPGYEQRRWIYAAGLAYEIGCVYHELEKHEESNQWIEPLQVCLERESFHGFWERIYDDGGIDTVNDLTLPGNADDNAHFLQALTWVAKLYDLKGLNASNDTEARTYLDKALKRAQKSSDQIVHTWIEIHIGDLEDRNGNPTATRHYENALNIANAAQLSTLDVAKQSEIIHLKLTCYNKLGRLAFVDAGRNHSQAIDWYQKQLDLAEEHGRRDFKVLAHEGLAKIYFQSNPQDLQKASQHTIDAWNSNQEFHNAGSEVIELKDFINLIISIMKSSISQDSQPSIIP
jgi:hypothetical protein